MRASPTPENILRLLVQAMPKSRRQPVSVARLYYEAHLRASAGSACWSKDMLSLPAGVPRKLALLMNFW